MRLFNGGATPSFRTCIGLAAILALAYSPTFGEKKEDKDKGKGKDKDKDEDSYDYKDAKDDHDWDQPEFQPADRPMSFVKQLWGIFNLIPFPLVAEPEQILEIEYANKIELGVGRFLFPLDLRYPPVKVFWPKQYVRSYYTLVMTDLDYPAERDKSMAEYLYWIVGNIEGPLHNRQNETIAQYVGPRPRQGTGLHRVMYFLYRHKNRVEFTHEPKLGPARNDTRRLRFSSRNFAKKYKLGQPEAVTFCLLQFWHRNKTKDEDDYSEEPEPEGFSTIANSE